jgi:endoribonuclease Dicer
VCLKCLADVVEAYVGAVFIDSGFDFAEVQRFFKDNVQNYFQDISLYDMHVSHHPVVSIISIEFLSMRTLLLSKFHEERE